MSLSNLYGDVDEKIESIIKIKSIGKKEILVQPLMEMVHLVPRGSAVVLAPWSSQANNPPAPRHDAANSEGERGNCGDGGDTEAQVRGGSVAGSNPGSILFVGGRWSVGVSLCVCPCGASGSSGLFPGEIGTIGLLAGKVISASGIVSCNAGVRRAISIGAIRDRLFVIGECALPTGNNQANVVCTAKSLGSSGSGVGCGKSNSDLCSHL